MKNKIIMILEQDLIYPYLDIRPFKEADTLKNRGYEVDFLTWNFYKQNKYKFTEDYKGFKIFRLQYKKINKFISAFQYFFCFISTFCYIKKHSYDIVHCHDTLPLLCSLLAKLFLGKKLVYDAHELSTEMGKPKFVSNYFKFIEFISCKFWDLLITTNKERTALILYRYPITNISLVILNNYPKIDYYDYHNLKKKSEVLTIIYQGEISKKRETHRLIEAFKKLDIDYRLLLIGKCKDEMYFKKIIHDNNLDSKIILMQALVNYELHKLMKEAHIGIISLDMNLLNNALCEPNKLYEYLLFGMTVFMPDCIHFNEFAKVFPNNSIIFYNQLHEIVASIKNYHLNIKDDDYLQRSKIIVKKYNWKAQENKLLKSYKELSRY